MSETNEQRLAREKAEDEATMKAFMGEPVKGSTTFVREAPATEEEAQEARNKEAYEAKEAAAATARAIRQNQVAEASDYINNADDEKVRRIEDSRWTPKFIQDYSIRRIREQAANRTDDDRIAQAKALSERNKTWENIRVNNERMDDEHLTGLAKKLIKGALPAVRQPTSFTRGDDMDVTRKALENAKKKP